MRVRRPGLSDPSTRLLDFEGGLIHEAALVSDVVFAAEQRTIFRETWLFLALDSQLRHGERFETWMGATPVTVARSARGRVRARVCGQGLTPVPRVETVHGLVFGCWDPDAVPLADECGTTLSEFTAAFSSFGAELLGPTHRWTVHENWKTCVATDVLLFPTFSYVPNLRAIRVWHPKGPQRTDAWVWVLIESTVRGEVRDAIEAFARRAVPADGLLPGSPSAAASHRCRLDDSNRAFYERWSDAITWAESPRRSSWARER